MPPDKSVYWKIIFFISHPKHMLWVLKRTVSMRLFFRAPKTHVLIDGLENHYSFMIIKFPYLDLCFIEDRGIFFGLLVCVCV